MTSTEMIYDIVEKYGDDKKYNLNRDLKKLRTKVRGEVLSPIRYAINKSKTL